MVANDVWTSWSKQVQKIDREQGDFIIFFSIMADKPNIDDLAGFLVIAWNIWIQRNLIIHDGKFQNLKHIVESSMRLLLDYQQTQSSLWKNQHIEMVNATQHTWSPSIGCAFKINWFISLSHSEDCFGHGIIIRNSQGQVMAGRNSKLPAMNQHLDAYLLGAIDAVRFSLEAGLCNIVLECDFPEFCKAMDCDNTQLSLLGHLIRELKLLLQQCQKWELSVISKIGNRVAQSIAVFAFSISGIVVWLEELPSSFTAVLADDVLHI